jgi:hypothetical protein
MGPAGSASRGQWASFGAINDATGILRRQAPRHCQQRSVVLFDHEVSAQAPAIGVRCRKAGGDPGRVQLCLNLGADAGYRAIGLLIRQLIRQRAGS